MAACTSFFLLPLGNFEIDRYCDYIYHFFSSNLPHYMFHGTHSFVAHLDSRNSHPAYQDNQQANKRRKVLQKQFVVGMVLS